MTMYSKCSYPSLKYFFLYISQFYFLYLNFYKNYFFSAGFVVWDMPWGTLFDKTRNPDVAWDVQVKPDTLFNILKQVDAANSAPAYKIAIWHKSYDTSMVEDEMRRKGFKSLSQLYWIKENHSTPTPVNSYTQAVEMCTIGCYPNANECKWSMNTNPVLRGNYFVMPAITSYLRDSKGHQCNPCQKPLPLNKRLTCQHCPPGDRVLVIGAGAGGEVLGAASAGRHVTAVESDERQFNLLKMHMFDLQQQQQKELEAKIVDLDSSAAITGASGGSGGGDGEEVPETQEDKIAKIPKCVECDAALHAVNDVWHQCPNCSSGKVVCDQLGKCCEEVDGKIYCASHAPKKPEISTVAVASVESQAY